jgi:uncharacterized membrane protein
MLIGMIFINPLLAAAMGAGAGAILGVLSDIGISTEFMKDLGEIFKPGISAPFILVKKATPDKVLERLKHFKGKVINTSLTADEESELRAALEMK